MQHLIYLALIVWWIIGLVLANGFWSTLFAICIPPYSFYLVVEWVMKLMEVI